MVGTPKCSSLIIRGGTRKVCNNNKYKSTILCLIMGERYSLKDGIKENNRRFIENRNRAVTDFLQMPEYIGERNKICWRYFRFFKWDPAFGIDDLQITADMKVIEIADRYPEKLDVMPYVKKAIQNAIFGLMRKRKRTLGEVCMVHEYDDGVPGPNLVVPIKDTQIERATELEDMLYQIKQEFGEKAAENLEALLDKCQGIYDLNLPEPPSTETKDRIKVVTAMDLSDEEMFVYAEVLLGVRARFKKGYLQCDYDDPEAKRRGVKYLSQVLEALGISPLEFAKSRNKQEQLIKYRLFNYYCKVFDSDIGNFVMALDGSIDRQDIFHARKWEMDVINVQGIIEKIRRLTIDLKREPKREEFDRECPGVLEHMFHHTPKFAIEFAFPGTYPEYSEKARELYRIHGVNCKDYEQTKIPGSEFLAGKGMGHPVNQETINRIIEIYNSCHGNAKEAARITGFSDATIRRYWEAHGLERKGRRGQGRAITPDNVVDIVSSYERFEGKIRRAAQALGYDRATIKKYWEAHNLIESNRLTEEEKEELIGYYDLCEGNMSAAARHFSRGINTIRRCWLKEGLKAKGKRGRPRV